MCVIPFFAQNNEIGRKGHGSYPMINGSKGLVVGIDGISGGECPLGVMVLVADEREQIFVSRQK